MIPASAAAILEYIGKHEAPRGYVDYYRGAKPPPRPLTDMTVREVLDWQAWANPPGPGTAAAGRYQIIRPTLEWLVQDMGLRGDEKFSRNLQDKMGLRLLQRRGFDAFIEGGSAEDFCNSLAKEWASMPVVSGPKRGKSYYAGDGVNRSLTRADEFLDVVKQSRAPQAAPVPPARPTVEVALGGGAAATAAAAGLAGEWWIAGLIVAVAVVFVIWRIIGRT